MNRRLGLSALFLAALMTTSTALAFDCSTKVDLPARPDIKKTSDYALFVAKVVKYKNAKRDSMLQKHKCPDLYATPTPPPTPPETINGAVQAAASSPAAGNAPQQGFPSLGSGQLASTSIITPLDFLHGDNQPQQLPPLPFDVIDALNSGDPASKELRDYLTRQLPTQDQATGEAFQVALNGSSQASILNQSGNLYILMNVNGDVLRTDGTVRSESCLSSGCPFDNATLQLQVPVPGWQ